MHLLSAVYGRIITTNEVVQEFGEELPEWVEVRDPHDIVRYEMIRHQVGRGEASAIVLALEINGSILILDDKKARTIAADLGLTITGTLGVVVKAKLMGVIPSVKPWLHRFRLEGFRTSDPVERALLYAAGEI